MQPSFVSLRQGGGPMPCRDDEPMLAHDSVLAVEQGVNSSGLARVCPSMKDARIKAFGQKHFAM